MIRARSVQNSRKRYRTRLNLERLEDRTVPSTFWVVNTNDDGPGSLRRAINDANANPNIGGPDLISFNIPASGVQTIHVGNMTGVALPAITDPVIVDATTQPGFAGMPLIELDGSGAGAGANGLSILGGYFANEGLDCTVKGFVINRFSGDGIHLGASRGNTIQGNYIGTDASGMVALGNGGDGIIDGPHPDFASNSLIGGTGPGEGNLISGNGISGIHLGHARGDIIQGNFIGTNRTGTAALGNAADGVFVEGGADITIGGTTAAARNIVSGSRGTSRPPGYPVTGVGIEMSASGLIQGNFIGTDVTGTYAIPNGGGIYISSGGVQVGGIAPGARNVISGNWDRGISMGQGSSATDVHAPIDTQIQGNYIGTDVTGAHGLGNGTGIFGGARVLIGGTAPGAGNIIVSGLRYSYANVIQGNLIGTDVTGTQDFAGGGLALFDGGSYNTIGGTTPESQNIIVGGLSFGGASGNVIQGNQIRMGGITFIDPFVGASGNVIEGNTITTNSIGDLFGVYLGGASNTANVVQGNYISGFRRIGVSVGGSNNTVEGNTITHNGDGSFLHGTGVTVSGVNNLIRANSIHDNALLGIDLRPVGQVNVNDPLDTDTSPGVPNQGQNYPVLTSAVSTGSGSVINGTLNSVPNSTFTIDFYSNSDLNPSGYAEGEYYLGFVVVTTDGSGNASFSAAVGTLHGPAGLVTATATDSANNTSEFSRVENKATLIADPCNPTQTALVVVGSLDRDIIVLSSGTNAGDIVVTINGNASGTFHPTGRIIAYGQDGDDDIQMAGSILLPGWLYGGEGSDRLKGGNGPNVLVGGLGFFGDSQDDEDFLVGGSGRDLLIGGVGADRIVGNGGDDIVIGGRSTIALDYHALCAVMNEWTSNHDFATRVANLNNTNTGSSFLGRLNEDYFLIEGVTVFEDGSRDTLTGSAGLDWFFAGTADRITDLSASDWEFIFSV